MQLIGHTIKTVHYRCSLNLPSRLYWSVRSYFSFRNPDFNWLEPSVLLDYEEFSFYILIDLFEGYKEFIFNFLNYGGSLRE